MQKPDATLVAGFNSWQKNFDRHVNKGEKGIRIMAPAPYKKKQEVDVIDKNTGKQAFYKTNGTVVCPKYRCYLTVPTTLTNAFYFDNEGATTGIEAIFGGENEEVVIYDLSGKRLSRLQKGVNIVNGHKVIVK